MASAGLKRSSSSDVPPHSDISSPFWPSNKRLCTTNYSPPNNLQMQQPHQHQQQPQQQQQQQQQRPFKDPSLILGSLSDEVTSLIKNEINKQHHHSHHHHHHHNTHQHHTNIGSPSSSHQHHNQHISTSPSSNPSSHQHATSMDTPILSIRQTKQIVEEVIRNREHRLREEYDKILISKLSEQYDTFVKYTQDHIESRYNEQNSHQASYLS